MTMDADTNKTKIENGSVPPSSNGQLDHEVRRLHCIEMETKEDILKYFNEHLEYKLNSIIRENDILFTVKYFCFYYANA
jgi:hypothetical protein